MLTCPSPRNLAAKMRRGAVKRAAQALTRRPARGARGRGRCAEATLTAWAHRSQSVVVAGPGGEFLPARRATGPPTSIAEAIAPDTERLRSRGGAPAGRRAPLRPAPGRGPRGSAGQRTRVAGDREPARADQPRSDPRRGGGEPLRRGDGEHED